MPTSRTHLASSALLASLATCFVSVWPARAGAQPVTEEGAGPLPPLPPPDTTEPDARPPRSANDDRATPAAPAAAPPTARAEPEARPPAEKDTETKLDVTPTGYVEAYAAYNFNRPRNGITNYRGFDNRHATFSLSNAVLGANWRAGPVSGRLLLQIGSTPSTVYLGEPARGGASGANATSGELWKYLQEAFVAYRAPVFRGLLLQLGLFASPIGFEAFAVKDNWNWSRSNPFFGLPFYHTGLRATYAWTDELTTTASVFNGWNSVVDNNEEKSLETHVTYRKADRLLLQALYFGGIERPTGSREGPYWRHHFDVVARYDATSWLSVAAEGDHGWEPNRIGTARWTAGALYARVRPARPLYIALRGDRFHEHLATGGGRSSTALFFGGVEWVSSGTVTVDARPHEQISVRVEYRHDVADTPLYFEGTVAGDGTSASPYVPNARTQDTLLLGATAWF